MALTHDDAVMALLSEAKAIAQRYYQLTGKPLGITGEVAEYEAARLLGLTLAEARTSGFDATASRNGVTIRFQIKGRCLGAQSSKSQRVGALKLSQEWDAALLVILGPDFEPLEIWEAPRPALEAALKKPGSRSRNERGALGVGQFKRLGVQVWPKPA